MIPRSVHVVMHGGLGNQLFQLFSAQTYALMSDLNFIQLHVELLSKYRTKRILEIEPLLTEDAFFKCLVTQMPIVGRFRIPKILSKTTGRDRILAIPMLGYFADGYFQSLQDYSPSQLNETAIVLENWRKELRRQGYLSSNVRGRLVHIRLGDFFDQPEVALSHATTRLSEISGYADVITDSEEILMKAIHGIGRSNNFKIVSSSQRKSWEVLTIMSGYAEISTNGSSLACWATLLSNSLLITSDLRHQAFRLSFDS